MGLSDETITQSTSRFIHLAELIMTVYIYGNAASVNYHEASSNEVCVQYQSTTQKIAHNT